MDILLAPAVIVEMKDIIAIDEQMKQLLLAKYDMIKKMSEKYKISSSDIEFLISRIRE